jgi:hypothetical protein
MLYVDNYEPKILSGGKTVHVVLKSAQKPAGEGVSVEDGQSNASLSPPPISQLIRGYFIYGEDDITISNCWKKLSENIHLFR